MKMLAWAESSYMGPTLLMMQSNTENRILTLLANLQVGLSFNPMLDPRTPIIPKHVSLPPAR
jgi:hypothetical protein